MPWELIGGLIKGLGDTIFKYIDEFTVSDEEKAKLKQQIMDTHLNFQRDMWKLEDADRANARKREVDTGDKTTRQLAWLYTGGYFGIFILLISGAFEIQDGIKQLVDVLMAVLTAGQYSILAYYFGSSHGSSEKTKTLDRVVNHKEP